MGRGCGEYMIDKIYKRILDSSNNENVFVSPLSIMMLLVILESIVDIEAKEEMDSLLIDESNFLQSIEKMSATESLLNANVIGICDDYQGYLNYELLKRVNAKFDVEVLRPNKLNQWVQERTSGMIDRVVSEDDIALALVNAMSFVADWKDKYSADRIDENGVFMGSKGEERVVMLGSDERYFVESDGAYGFVKEYKDDAFELMCVLGDCALSIRQLGELYKTKTEVKVKAWMPEFSFGGEYEISDILKSIGLKKVFDKGALALINLCDAGIDQVNHKTYIQVNRKGTKAAAVSSAVVFTSLLEEVKYVCLNKPFTFAIMHKDTGMCVFVGKVNYINV